MGPQSPHGCSGRRPTALTDLDQSAIAALSPLPSPPVVTGLRVATYNIHSAVGLDRRHDLARIIRVINELEADIVGLQEVAGSPDADAMQLIADACGYSAVAGPNIVRHRSRFGNLLLSRPPVLDYRLLDLSVGAREPRGAIEARIEVPDGPLRVMVTHLGLRRGERRMQLARLRAVVSADEIPSVVLGDFNAPTRRELQRAGFGGRQALGLAPRSFPSNVPVLALDRIWTRPDALISSVIAHRSPLARLASDHLPVVATLSVQSPVLPPVF